MDVVPYEESYLNLQAQFSSSSFGQSSISLKSAKGWKPTVDNRQQHITVSNIKVKYVLDFLTSLPSEMCKNQKAFSWHKDNGYRIELLSGLKKHLGMYLRSSAVQHIIQCNRCSAMYNVIVEVECAAGAWRLVYICWCFCSHYIYWHIFCKLQLHSLFGGCIYLFLAWVTCIVWVTLSCML